MEHQQHHAQGVFNYRWKEWSVTTSTQLRHLPAKDSDRSFIEQLLLLPLPFVWMHQWVSNVLHHYADRFIPCGAVAMGWLNAWWLPNRHPDPSCHVGTKDTTTDVDNDSEDENDSTGDDMIHSKLHKDSDYPSDVVTITEFDDDDTSTTSTKDVDTEHHDDALDTARNRVITKTKLETKLTSYTIDDFDRHRVLGTGQFGQVWLVSEKNKSAATSATNVSTYALKMISKYDLIATDEVDMIVREKNVMYQLSEGQPHPFIVQLQATFQDDNFLFLLQEFCRGGELFRLMHNSNTNSNNNNPICLPANQVAFYTLCIADALEYMHTQHSIVYRDLKPENIMLDRCGYPKLVDMGYAKRLTKEDGHMTFTFCGTPNYTAPEMIQISSTQGASFEVDHWAMGILVHEMLYGHHPFNTQDDDMEQMELFHCICHDEYTPVAPPESDDADVDERTANAFHLILQLLMKDPQQRLGRSILGGDSIGDHSFLKNAYNIDELRKQTIVAPWIPQLDTTASTSATTTDWFAQQYPKLTKREKALFDAF